MEFKIIFIGDCSVGKSSIIARYSNIISTTQSIPTIGVQFSVFHLIINNVPLKLNVWDTSGSERFSMLTSNFRRKIDGIILCFDLTDISTLENLDKWINDIIIDINKDINDIVIFLVGNKNDLEYKSTAEIQMLSFVRKYKIQSFFICSALTGHRIKDIFEQIGEFLLNNYLIRHHSIGSNEEADQSSKIFRPIKTPEINLNKNLNKNSIKEFSRCCQIL